MSLSLLELRLYTIVPGRHGVAYERFGQCLPPLFARHGIRNIGCWTANAGPNGPMWAYLMSYESLAEREAQWAAFYEGPQWWAIRAETQGDEEATARYDIHFLRINATLAEQALGPDHAYPTGIQDLIFAETALGQGAAVNAFLGDTYLPAIRRAGGRPKLLADFISGPHLPRIALIIDWDNAAHRDKGWRLLRDDGPLLDAFAAQRKTRGVALMTRMDIHLLEPLIREG
ncbi:MAG: NIPSNAP family protein [Sphingobium sp.]